PGRVEHMVGEVVGVALPGGDLHDPPGEHIVVVVVGDQLTGRADPVGANLGGELLERGQVAVLPLGPAVDVVVETGGVGEQVVQRGRLARVGLRDRVFQVVADIGV